MKIWVIPMGFTKPRFYFFRDLILCGTITHVVIDIYEVVYKNGNKIGQFRVLQITSVLAGSTVMFGLSKSFSLILLKVYHGKIDFIGESILKIR